MQRVTSAGAGEILATENCILQVFLWGGGASGSVLANDNRGGGSGAAAVAIAKLLRGQRATYEVGAGGPSQVTALRLGNDGGDTWVRFPTGLTVLAGGGKGSGAPGLASGGLVQKAGVASGLSFSAGADAPSLTEYSNFSDFMGGTGSAPGFGVGSLAGGSPSAGSGGTDGSGQSGVGGVGRLIYVLGRLA